METTDVWKMNLQQAYETLAQVMQSEDFLSRCNQFSQMVIDTYVNNGSVFSCGNGGSHCDAMHFAEELTGRYRKNRRPLGALALGDPSHTTCVSNDYGFEHIFSRQLEGLGRQGDLLIAISTSGNSQNVIEAVRTAKSKSISTVGLLGKDGGKLKDLVDLALVVPAQTADRIQEIHIKLIHTVIESMERKLFPENYA